MIRLIALDADGTLLPPSGVVQEGVKQAIRRARAEGVKVVLATGRPVPDAARIAQEAGCDPIAICLGGAELVDFLQGDVIHRWDLPQNLGEQLVQLALSRGLECIFFAQGQIITNAMSKKKLLIWYPDPEFHRHTLVTEDPLAYMQAHQLRLTKFYGGGEPDQIPWAELSQWEGIHLTSSRPNSFEVTAKGVHKGMALAQLADHWHCQREECAAVGDSLNDLEMLEWAGHSIAMANGAPQLKKIAHWVCHSVQEEGVAQAIAYCLQRRT